MLKGKKTYILAGLLALSVAVPVIFKIQIPEYVYAVLAAVGLGAFRLAVAELAENKGWKTFGSVGAVVVIAVLQALNVALPYDTIYGLCAALGLVGIRNAVSKLE